jgi:hypothetical protein
LIAFWEIGSDHKIMKPLFVIRCVMLPVLCLSLVGCDKVKTALAERDRNIARLNALIAENKELEDHMAALKKALPADPAADKIPGAAVGEGKGKFGKDW